MVAVVWYSVAIGGPLATSIVVNFALLTLTILRYIAERDLSRYPSLKQIFLGIRPLMNITWLDLITIVVLVSANFVTISYGVQDITGFIRLSRVLSVVNMAPLFLGARMNLITSHPPGPDPRRCVSFDPPVA
ncbi:hypothetical protein EV126DRAFT_516624 [Verticillium dahliae]|nr:hypothetical protein EV126DRAFT_516624 [Verticillium dahliae]